MIKKNKWTLLVGSLITLSPMLLGIFGKHLMPPEIIEPIQHLKVEHLGNHNPRLHTDEVLVALSVCADKGEGILVNFKLNSSFLIRKKLYFLKALKLLSRAVNSTIRLR